MSEEVDAGGSQHTFSSTKGDCAFKDDLGRDWWRMVVYNRFVKGYKKYHVQHGSDIESGLKCKLG